MSLKRTSLGEHYPRINDEPEIRTEPPAQLEAFEDLYWLFSCGTHNRSIARIDFDEAALLFRTVKRSRGPILEIGRRHGGSTIIMLVASQGRPMVSIDFDPNHFPTVDRFLASPQLTRNLQVLTANSREPIPDASFGMIFFDGDHSFEGLTMDIRAHWSELQSFDGVPAICAFHDVDQRKISLPFEAFDLSSTSALETVTAAASMVLAAGCARIVGFAGSLCVMEKVADLPQEFGGVISRTWDESGF